MTFEDRIKNIDWEKYKGPERYNPSELVEALLDLNDHDSSRAVNGLDNKVLFAVGNNHGGSYYPAILEVAGVLTDMAKWHENVEVRITAFSILGDLYYFFPEIGSYSEHSQDEIELFVKTKLQCFSEDFFWTEICKNRILHFLMGNEDVEQFESWVYSTKNLESSIDTDTYIELISFNYKERDVIHRLKKVVVGSFIPQQEYDDFEYEMILRKAGWFSERKIDKDNQGTGKTPAFENATRITEEFGGLKYTSKKDYIFIKFFERPPFVENVKKFGIDKNIACFASADNDHVELYVDDQNQFYSLDNVVIEDLYMYKGSGFKQMMRELLRLDDADNFEKVGSKV